MDWPAAAAGRDSVVPIADIGLTLPMALAGLAIGLGILAGIAIVSAAVGVLIFGPRDVDSLIIPGMATFGVVIVALFASRPTIGIPMLLALAATVGIGASAIQRFVGDRLDEDSPRWPLFVLAGGIVAGASIGGVLGLVMNLQGGLSFALAAALVGAILGGFLSQRQRVTSDDDRGPEAPG